MTCVLVRLFDTFAFLDDSDVYDGGPVGIQLVGRKFEEEKVLAVAKIVTAALEKMKSEASVQCTNVHFPSLKGSACVLS